MTGIVLRSLALTSSRETQLQEDFDNQTLAFDLCSIVNRALHATAAHLHRYRYELSSTQDSLVEVKLRHDHYNVSLVKASREPCNYTSECFIQAESHLKQVKAFLWELESKLQNILALVSILIFNESFFQRSKIMRLTDCSSSTGSKSPITV